MAALAKRQALPPGRLRQPVARAEQGRRVAHRRRRPFVASTAGAAYHPGPVPSASASASPAACAPADIVLSLFTSQSSYAKGARPRFSVYAVLYLGDRVHAGVRR